MPAVANWWSWSPTLSVPTLPASLKPNRSRATPPTALYQSLPPKPPSAIEVLGAVLQPAVQADHRGLQADAAEVAVIDQGTFDDVLGLPSRAAPLLSRDELSPLLAPLPTVLDRRREADAEAEAAEARRVVADLGRVVGLGREHALAGDARDDEARAVDTARAGRDRLAADDAVVDRTVLVAHPQLAPAAAQEDPGLVGVEGAGWCRPRTRSCAPYSSPVCSLLPRARTWTSVSLRKSRPRALSGSQLQVVLLAAARLGAQEAGDRDVERAARLHLGGTRRRRQPQRSHAGADDRGRAQQNPA